MTAHAQIDLSVHEFPGDTWDTMARVLPAKSSADGGTHWLAFTVNGVKVTLFREDFPPAEDESAGLDRIGELTQA